MSSITSQEEFDRQLGAYLLERRYVEPGMYQEALTEQMVSGGTLSLNLWELGMAQIDELSAWASQLFELDAIRSERAKGVPAEALELLTRSFVRHSALLPVAATPRELHVASAQPWRLDLLDEAAARSGRRIVAHFMCDVGILRLLHTHYEIVPPPRYRVTPMRDLGRGRSKSTGAASVEEPLGELTTEEEFLRLYASDIHATQESDELDQEYGEELVLSDLLEPETLSLSALGPIPILTAAEAIAELESAPSRLELGDTLVRFGLSFAPRVALFTCRKDVWIGWTGAGPGIDPMRMQELMVPVVEGTAFGLVHRGGAPLVGPLAPHPVHRAFASAVGARPESSVGLFPVHHRGRVLFVIYLDGGESGVPNVSEILILAQRVPASLERMVLRARRAACAA